MSVTFYSNASCAKATREEPCLCAQMAECWSLEARLDEEAVRAELREHADPRCPWCNGSGVEAVESDDLPELNLCNMNAAAFLAFLGVPEEPAGLMGSMVLADARRAVMRASARSNVAKFCRPGHAVYGKPRAGDDGVVELRPLREVWCELGEEQMLSYLERFRVLVEESAERGATEIYWG